MGPFFTSFFAFISSHSGIWEKWPPTLFICSPIGGHMQIFRNFWRLIFEIVYSGTYFCIIVKALSRRRTLPAPPWLKLVEKTRPPSGYRVRIYFAIRRRRACLGMPTDGGRWCVWGALTLEMSCGKVRFNMGQNRSLSRVTECKKKSFLQQTETIFNCFCVVEDIDRSSWPLASTFSSPPGREMECTQLFQVIWWEKNE